MKNTKKYIKLLIIMILLLGFLPPLQVHAAGKFASGSSIGGVPVEGLTKEEAKMKLQEEAAEWLSKGDLLAEGEYGEVVIPRSLFSFDFEQSLQALEEKTKRHWSTFFLKKKNVHIPIAVQVKEAYQDNLPNYVDKEKLIGDAMTLASNFEEGPLTVEYVEKPVVNLEEIATVTFSVPDLSAAVTKYIVEELDGYTLEPESAFSFLDHVVLLEGMANAEEEMSFIASALYRLVLQTNIEIIERHSQRVVPSYTEAGLEVQVNRDEKEDFLIFNPNEHAYTIHASINENEFVMSLESIKPKQTYAYSVVEKEEIEYKTIYRYSPDLNPWERETIQAGKNGLQVELYRGMEGTSMEEKERISRDYYPATPEIILVSSKEETSEIPTELEQLDISNIDSLLNPDGTASENLTEEDYSQLFLACLLQSSEETDESTVAEEEFDICDLMWLSLFFSMMGGEDEVLTDVEGTEPEQTTEDIEAALEKELEEVK